MIDPKLRGIIFATTAAAMVAGCGADDVASPGEGQIIVVAPTPPTTPPPPPPPTPPTSGPAADCPAGFTNAGVISNLRNCQISGRLSANLNLAKRAGTIYSLSGRVDVGTDIGADGAAAGGNGVTLSVDPGVVIFGESDASFLVVNRGSRLQASGTSTQPIIFTGRRNVENNVTDNSQALWGGIVLLGRAPISDCLGGGTGGTVNCQQQFEALTNAPYGGDVVADSSGSLQFVQVRYAGLNVADGREINGISFAGTGSGTTVDHVQVHNSSDDGIEWFGGRTNASYLVLTGNDDDNIDTDLGYKGNLQFVIVAQRIGGQSGDSIIEADSNGNEDATPRQDTRLANFTFIHRSTLAGSINAILLRGGTDYKMANGIVVSPRTCLDIDGAATVQAVNPGLDELGAPLFQSVVFDCDTAAYQNDGNVDIATIQGIFEAAGNNNNASFVNSLTSLYVNGAAETGVTPFDPTAFGSFFVAANYIGAVRDANDIWYRGWTCDSGTADFGSGSSCLTIPAL